MDDSPTLITAAVRSRLDGALQVLLGQGTADSEAASRSILEATVYLDLLDEQLKAAGPGVQEEPLPRGHDEVYLYVLKPLAIAIAERFRKPPVDEAVERFLAGGLEGRDVVDLVEAHAYSVASSGCGASSGRSGRGGPAKPR